MADLGNAIYAILAGNAGVTALVPTTIATYKFNIFPGLAPETIGNVAYIVYKRISGVEDATLSGDSQLCESRIQLDCIAPTYDAATAIRDAVMASGSLQGYAGTIGGVTIQSCFEVNQHEFNQPSPSNLSLRSYGRSIDFDIWHVGPA